MRDAATGSSDCTRIYSTPAIHLEQCVDRIDIQKFERRRKKNPSRGQRVEKKKNTQIGFVERRCGRKLYHHYVNGV